MKDQTCKEERKGNCLTRAEQGTNREITENKEMRIKVRWERSEGMKDGNKEKEDEYRINDRGKAQGRMKGIWTK
jgi:hypothetical protein